VWGNNAQFVVLEAAVETVTILRYMVTSFFLSSWFRARSGHVGGKYLYRYYDLYRRLRLQFLVLLMMGAVDTRNMYSDFEVK